MTTKVYSILFHAHVVTHLLHTVVSTRRARNITHHVRLLLSEDRPFLSQCSGLCVFMREHLSLMCGFIQTAINVLLLFIVVVVVTGLHPLTEEF